MGRDGADGSGEEVPSGEGLSGHAATARGSGRHRRRRGSRQESQRGVKREPGSPSTFNGERDIPILAVGDTSFAGISDCQRVAGEWRYPESSATANSATSARRVV